jgi:PilZ domain
MARNSRDGGGGHDGRGISVAAPAGWVRHGDRCAVVVRDQRRAGFEIEGRVVGFAQGDQRDEVIQLAVVAVRRVKTRRVAARVEVCESAVIEGPARAIDVVVVDVATHGFGFITNQSFTIGEELSVVLNVGNRVLPVTAQVANVTPSEDERVRVGCRFLEIAQVYRHLLDGLTREASTPSDRRADRPDLPQDAAAAGPSSAFVRRLQQHGQARSTSPPATDRQLTMLYCRPCGRFTLHVKPSAGHADYSCVTCQLDPSQTPTAA